MTRKAVSTLSFNTRTLMFDVYWNNGNWSFNSNGVNALTDKTNILATFYILVRADFRRVCYGSSRRQGRSNTPWLRAKHLVKT